MSEALFFIFGGALTLLGVAFFPRSTQAAIPPNGGINRAAVSDSNTLDIERVRRIAADKIRAREGYRRTVYEDSEGFLTVGIGHKVLPTDNLKLGSKISDARVIDFFEKDFSIALNAALDQAGQLKVKDENFIASLVSVNFQLGTNWPSVHVKTWDLMRRGLFQQAAIEAANSLWYNQTPTRVKDFQQALRSVA